MDYKVNRKMSESDAEEIINNVLVSKEITRNMDFLDRQYQDLLDQRILLFNDICDSNIVEKFMLPLLMMDNDGSGKPITIYISTGGGSVYDTLPLCNIIENLKTKTNIYVLGYVYSMGSIITMSGFKNPNVKRYCYPFSTALIHGGSSVIDGTAKQVKDYYKFNERFEERIKEFILSHTNENFTEDDYTEIDNGFEHYLDSDEMLKIGLIDEIIK